MKYKPLGPIELTPEEAARWASVRRFLDDSSSGHEEWRVAGPEAAALVRSLEARSAIPTIRVRIFADPSLAESGSTSPRQTFARNGTSGDQLRQHPNFFPFLRYFIEGTQPEGMAADELGNVFGGLTGGCDQSKSGGCLQKFVRK